MGGIAKLIIKDEVNVHLDGVDLSLRKELVKKFKFEVPGAKYQPSVRLGRWDGKISYFNLGGTTYINLLPDIIPILIDHGYKIELCDSRQHSEMTLETIDEDSFSSSCWADGHPMAGQPIKLRDYQIEIVNKFLTNQQCMQEVATGAGKTLITAALSKSIEGYGRSLIIVPNKSLVTQTEADYVNMGLDVGVYYGDRKEVGRKHTICTWQSVERLSASSEGRSSRDEPASFRLVADPNDFIIDDITDGLVCVIVDEAHSAKSTVLRGLLGGVLATVPIRWGLTGTVPKEDAYFMSLRCCIGEVVNQLRASELQEAGHLADCHINLIQMVDHGEFKDYQKELKYLTTNPARLSFVAKFISQVAKDGNTLVLVDRIETGKMLQIELSNVFSLLSDKPEVAFVSGSTKSKDRKAEYDEIGSGDNKILIATYGVAAVGINIVRLHNVVLFEVGKSFVRVIQSIGRGLRKGGDKDHVEIYDISSTCKFSRRHLTKRKQFYNEAGYKFSAEKIDWSSK